MIPLYMIKRQYEEESEHQGSYDVGMVFMEELKEGEALSTLDTSVAHEWYSVARFIDYDEAEKFVIDKNKDWKFVAKRINNMPLSYGNITEKVPMEKE